MQSLALDMDGVLADIVPRTIEWMEVNKDKTFTREEVVAWNWVSRHFGLTRDETKVMFNYAWRDWRRVFPIEDDLGEKVRALNKYYRVFVVTASSPEQVEGKMKWLEHYGLGWLPIVFVPFGETKEGLGFDIYLDDRADTIEKVTAEGKIGYLYHQPWNAACSAGLRIRFLMEAVP